MSTVRLDDDVAAALQREVTARGGSVTKAANQAMRRGLGLVRRAGGAGYAPPRPMEDPKTCRHPVNLRIGKQCAGCGSTL